jgi:hypothetical protein
MQKASFARLVFWDLIKPTCTYFVIKKRSIVFRFFGSVWDQKTDQLDDHRIRKQHPIVDAKIMQLCSSLGQRIRYII